MRKPALIILLVLALVAGLATSCGDDDDGGLGNVDNPEQSGSPRVRGSPGPDNGDEATPDGSTPGPTTSLAAGEDDVISAKVEAVIEAIQSRSSDQLEALSVDAIHGDDLDASADCIPTDSITIEAAEIKITPRQNDQVLAQVVFDVTNSDVPSASANWYFVRTESDWLLSEPPACPFG